MGYHIDLENITLEVYKQKLAVAWLPPSRRILQERLSERLDYFREADIKNLKELQKLLKQSELLKKLSELTLFEGDYLVILLREINSMLPKPNQLKDFPGIPSTATEKLAALGIKDTKHLFDKVLTPEKRQNLAFESDLSLELINELASLTDLSRIKWVGAIFARVLFDLGIKNVRDAAGTDPVELHQKVNELNRQRNYYKGQIGLNDMRIFVAAAAEVPLEIV
ncbi:MAG TPA: DUF4332 domain-containing protein [Saprospiraceae bacterium]|nr:DUF4332 domain-containing protein [Saprospiraceae bacterium]